MPPLSYTKYSYFESAPRPFLYTNLSLLSHLIVIIVTLEYILISVMKVFPCLFFKNISSYYQLRIFQIISFVCFFPIKFVDFTQILVPMTY